jgi:hypothetical protein
MSAGAVRRANAKRVNEDSLHCGVIRKGAD